MTSREDWAKCVLRPWSFIHTTEISVLAFSFAVWSRANGILQYFNKIQDSLGIPFCFHLFLIRYFHCSPILLLCDQQITPLIFSDVWHANTFEYIFAKILGGICCWQCAGMRHEVNLWTHKNRWAHAANLFTQQIQTICPSNEDVFVVIFQLWRHRYNGEDALTLGVFLFLCLSICLFRTELFAAVALYVSESDGDVVVGFAYFWTFGTWPALKTTWNNCKRLPTQGWDAGYGLALWFCYGREISLCVCPQL